MAWQNNAMITFHQLKETMPSIELCSGTGEAKKSRPTVIFMRCSSFFGSAGKMIPVIHSGTQIPACLHANKTSCLSGAAPSWLRTNPLHQRTSA